MSANTGIVIVLVAIIAGITVVQVVKHICNAAAGRVTPSPEVRVDMDDPNA